jgi:hypothetical protein
MAIIRDNIGIQNNPQNKNAIIVYIDNKEKCVEEFSWLWKSWLMWNINKEWDLVAFTNPAIIETIEKRFKHNNLSLLPMDSHAIKGTEWEGYGFVNSFSMFDNPAHNKLINEKYDYILKTDCDTFLTKNFKTIKLDTTKVHFGTGLYYPDQGIDLINMVREKIIATSKAMGLKYRNITHVGASMLGPTNTISSICILQKKITSILLKYGWQNGDVGKWPGWWKGTASMYAGEIAVNHLLKPMNTVLGNIDVYCTINKITSTDLHIHAWQVEDSEILFNKRLFHKGKLPKLKTNHRIESAGEYCSMIATHDLAELKIFASKLNFY